MCAIGKANVFCFQYPKWSEWFHVFHINFNACSDKMCQGPNKVIFRISQKGSLYPWTNQFNHVAGKCIDRNIVVSSTAAVGLGLFVFFDTINAHGRHVKIVRFSFQIWMASHAGRKRFGLYTNAVVVFLQGSEFNTQQRIRYSCSVEPHGLHS